VKISGYINALISLHQGIKSFRYETACASDTMQKNETSSCPMNQILPVATDCTDQAIVINQKDGGVTKLILQVI
jgi:hypothetical protein